MWGRADGDPYNSYYGDEPKSAPPARLRSRIGASLVIVALLGATARGGWLVFVRPAPVRGTGFREMPSVAFTVRCGFSHAASDDPILFPGQRGGSHRHSFFGNRTTDAFSSATSLRGQPTTCDHPGDTASYWLPSPVGAEWTAIRAYYGPGLLAPGELNPYPNGMGLIGGSAPQQVNQSPSRSGSVSDTNQSAMWSCGRAIDEPGWTETPPKCPSSTRLAARIVFGQCVRKSTDDQPLSRLADTAPVQSGTCPSSHPVGIPQLRIRAELSATPSALSSGPLSSLHADFLNAWDTATLQRLIDVCIRGERTADQIKLCGLPGTGPRVAGFGAKPTRRKLSNKA